MENTLIPTNLTDVTKVYDVNKLQVSLISTQLLLCQLMTNESTRLNSLFNYRDLLEQKLFDPNIVDHLSSEELIERYQLVLPAIQNSYNYLQKVGKDVNLDEVKVNIQLLDKSLKERELNENSLKEDSELVEAANALLSKLTFEGQ